MVGRLQIGVTISLVLAAFALVWSYGNLQYYAGQRELLADIEKTRAASVAQKEKIDAEISGLSDVELRERAIEWVRDNAR